MMRMKVSNRGSINLKMLALLAIVFVIGGAGMLWFVSASYEPFNFPFVLNMETSFPSASPVVNSTVTSSGIAGWQTYRNEDVGFVFQYPPEVEFAQGDSRRIDFPFIPGTLLQEKYLQIFLSSLRDEAECVHGEIESVVEESEIAIGGIQFKKQLGMGAAAGNIYERESYATQIDRSCIALEFVLHSANPGVYTTPPADFDRAKESEIFHEILSTFRVAE